MWPCYCYGVVYDSMSRWQVLILGEPPPEEPQTQLGLKLLVDMSGDEKVQPVGTQLGVPRELATKIRLATAQLFRCI